MLKSASRLTNAQELVPVQMGLYWIGSLEQEMDSKSMCQLPRNAKKIIIWFANILRQKPCSLTVQINP